MTPKTKNTIWIIFFAVLVVVSVTLIIIGLATHEEPGFVNPDRSWAHGAPLTVACRGYTAADDEACVTAASALDLVNGRLGFDMLMEQSGYVDIQIIMRAPVEVGADHCGRPGECFELRVDGDSYVQCDIRTMNISGGADNDLELLAVYHGLGHCLGLAHDDYEQSIMRPVQTPTEWGRLRPWISDWDRALLRERYYSP